MLTCREASKLVSQSFERRLPWHSRVALRLHLLACAACTQFKRQAEFIRRAARE
ncbi:MAG: zf-HC2 domain-containing protein, partial [Sulfurifustaceae bacterium]